VLVNYYEVITRIGEGLDAVGVAIMVAGTLYGICWVGPRSLRAGDDHDVVYRSTRQMIGRAILLGLEVLVAGDIIRTVATTPSFSSVGVLALIVAIRTFLSWSLELELTGRWPWRQAEALEPPPT
jgi:uncharacterized membrane protein